jgi:CheY-like chemotaxis protein
MIVDDSEDIRISLDFLLKANGYESICAESAEDCLEKLKKQTKKPDLILLDIMMPGMPVKELINKITDIKIAYMSAVWISDEDKQKLLAPDNVIDFISKPYEGDDLLKKIAKQVGE